MKAVKMKAAKKTASHSPSPASQLKQFIGKFSSAHQGLIRAVRQWLRKRLPAANELVYDNYNFFVIGYSFTERPSDTTVSIAAGAGGVGLAFYHGAVLPDPHKLLLGSGSQNRFIRIPSIEVLDDPRVQALITAAMAQSKAPAASSGKGRLIIRSISAKQRPRRK